MPPEGLFLVFDFGGLRSKSKRTCGLVIFGAPLKKMMLGVEAIKNRLKPSRENVLVAISLILKGSNG